jgi:ABC transport system ATP-binding/permease protein
MKLVPHLSIRLPKGQVEHFPLESDVVHIGRDAGSEYRVPDALKFVSGRHLQIRREGDQFFVTALGGANSTLVNGQPLEPGKPVLLHNGAIIRISDDRFGVSLGMTFSNPLEPQLPLQGYSKAGPPTPLTQTGTYIIGRSVESDIVLDTNQASRRHALLRITDGAPVIQDLGSRKGTFVNGQSVTQSVLGDGDLIQIGDVVLHYQDGALSRYESHGIRVDVVGMSKDVRLRGKKLRILDNISLSVLPREFIGIVGGSGAGKSTLLNALIGIRPGDGQVYLDRRDFYKEYEQFRSQLGYVPQSDILHMSLTVDKALGYSARLRLPGSISVEERRRRIDAVLDTVSMNSEQIRKTRVGDLSGGQRKRISIAVELLADPKLIYLDEATSGLDPGLEKKMMHTLRRMADQGRTIILVTHATANIVDTDHVAFLAEGELVYFGPPRETLDFFEVDDFADIYEKVEGSGAKWRQVFEETKPANYQKYVVERQKSAPPVQKREPVARESAVANSFRQFWVLTQRTLSVLASDPITLLLMLLLFPVTAVLQLVIATPEVLTGNLSILADAVAAAKNMTSSYVPLPATTIFIFVMGLEAVLVGLYVPPNELIRERSIFVRERMVNLQVLPYLLSKIAVYAFFSALQVILYLLVLSIGVRFPAQGLYFPGVLELGLTLFITMMAGIGAGMIVAAFSKSIDMAIYVLVMLLFFQFFFAGTVFDLRGNAFEPVSYLSTTRWSLNALGVTVDLQRLASSTILCNEIPQNPLVPAGATKTVCFNYPEAKKDLTLNYDKDMLLKSWVVLAGMTLLFLCVTGLLLNRITTD